jgi:tetratricopeptide (TPR) repeat protein
VASALGLLAIVTAATGTASIAKARHAAALELAYHQAAASDDLRVRRALLHRAAGSGASFEKLPGHDKTYFRTWARYSQSLLILGERGKAVGAAQRALALHPHSPDVLSLIARIESARGRPSAAARWEHLAYEILHESTTGPPTLPQDLETR